MTPILVVTLMLLVLTAVQYRSFLESEATPIRQILLFLSGSVFMFVGSAVLVGDLTEILFLRIMGSCFFGLMFTIGANRAKDMTGLQ